MYMFYEFINFYLEIDISCQYLQNISRSLNNTEKQKGYMNKIYIRI